MEWYETVGIIILVIIFVIVVFGVMIFLEEGGIILLLCLPILVALSPCWCTAYWLVRDRCELCGRREKRFGLRDKATEHREKCREKRKSEFDALPSSSLYSCQQCNNTLKVWPKKKWPSFKCKVCEKEVKNTGTNMHVCFTCCHTGGFKLKNRHHLCGDHGKETLGKVKWNSSGATVSFGNKTTEPEGVSEGTPTMTTVDETRNGGATCQESDNPPSTPSPPGGGSLQETDHPPPPYESSDEEESEEGAQMASTV